MLKKFDQYQRNKFELYVWYVVFKLYHRAPGNELLIMICCQPFPCQTTFYRAMIYDLQNCLHSSFYFPTSFLNDYVTKFRLRWQPTHCHFWTYNYVTKMRGLVCPVLYAHIDKINLLYGRIILLRDINGH